MRSLSLFAETPSESSGTRDGAMRGRALHIADAAEPFVRINKVQIERFDVPDLF